MNSSKAPDQKTSGANQLRKILPALQKENVIKHPSPSPKETILQVKLVPTKPVILNEGTLQQSLSPSFIVPSQLIKLTSPQIFKDIKLPYPPVVPNMTSLPKGENNQGTVLPVNPVVYPLLPIAETGENPLLVACSYVPAFRVPVDAILKKTQTTGKSSDILPRTAGHAKLDTGQNNQNTLRPTWQVSSLAQPATAMNQSVNTTVSNKTLSVTTTQKPGTVAKSTSLVDKTSSRDNKIHDSDKAKDAPTGLPVLSTQQEKPAEVSGSQQKTASFKMLQACTLLASQHPPHSADSHLNTTECITPKRKTPESPQSDLSYLTDEARDSKIPLQYQKRESSSPNKSKNEEKNLDQFTHLKCTESREKEVCKPFSLKIIQDDHTTLRKTGEHCDIPLYKSSLLDECSVKISKVNSINEKTSESEEKPKQVNKEERMTRGKRCRCCKRKRRKWKSEVQNCKRQHSCASSWSSSDTRQNRSHMKDAESPTKAVLSEEALHFQQLFATGQVDFNGKVRNVDHSSFPHKASSTGFNATNELVRESDYNPREECPTMHEDWSFPFHSSVGVSDKTADIDNVIIENEDPLSGVLQVTGIKKPIHIDYEWEESDEEPDKSVPNDSVYEEDFRPEQYSADISSSEHQWADKENAKQANNVEEKGQLNNGNHFRNMATVIENMIKSTAVPLQVTEFLGSLLSSTRLIQQTEACLDRSLDLQLGYHSEIHRAWNEHGDSWSNVRRGLYRQRQVISEVSQSLSSMLEHLVNQAAHICLSNVPATANLEVQTADPSETSSAPMESVNKTRKQFLFGCDSEIDMTEEECNTDVDLLEKDQVTVTQTTLLRSEYTKLKQKLHMKEWDPVQECSVQLTNITKPAMNLVKKSSTSKSSSSFVSESTKHMRLKKGAEDIELSAKDRADDRATETANGISVKKQVSNDESDRNHGKNRGTLPEDSGECSINNSSRERTPQVKRRLSDPEKETPPRKTVCTKSAEKDTVKHQATTGESNLVKLVGTKLLGHPEKNPRRKSKLEDLPSTSSLGCSAEQSTSDQPPAKGEVSWNSLTELSEDQKRIKRELARLDRIQKNLTKRSGEIIALYENIDTNCERLTVAKTGKDQEKKRYSERSPQNSKDKSSEDGRGCRKETSNAKKRRSNETTGNDQGDVLSQRKSSGHKGKELAKKKNEKSSVKYSSKEPMAKNNNKKSMTLTGRVYFKQSAYTDNTKKRPYESKNSSEKNDSESYRYKDIQANSIHSKRTGQCDKKRSEDEAVKKKEKKKSHGKQVGMNCMKNKYHRKQIETNRRDTEGMKEEERDWKNGEPKVTQNVQKEIKSNKNGKGSRRPAYIKSSYTAREEEKKTSKHTNRETYPNRKDLKCQNPCYKFVKGNNGKNKMKKGDLAVKKELKPEKVSPDSPEEVITPSKQRGLQYRQECLNIVDAVYNYEPLSEPFRSEVSSDEISDYYQIVKFPMSLLSVASRVRNRHYTELTHFVSDMRRIFWNCRLYNENGEKFIPNCAEVQEYFEEILAKTFPKVDFTGITGEPQFLPQLKNPPPMPDKAVPKSYKVMIPLELRALFT